MTQQRDDAIRVIERARTPAELFGPAGGDSAVRSYRRLARLTHPDLVHDGSSAAAARAFARLTFLWSQHRRRGSPSTVTTRRRTYTLGPRFATGEIAGLYQVRSGHPETTALLKLPRDAAHNDLLAREATALTQLVRDGDARFRPYAPRLIETFRHRDAATGTTRQANVIELLDGFFSLAEVRAAYPAGLDPRDVAWMWRRLLVALGYAHRAGVIHGAVLPEHVLIHPGDHGLALVGWCCSVPGCYATTDPTGRVPAVVRRYADGDHYPPEVLARQRASTATDVYMATRCMTGLLGDRVPRLLEMFAKGCTLPAPGRRPADAWRLLGEFDELLERLYGPRRFRPLVMPAKAG
jgi:hypothetical protein